MDIGNQLFTFGFFFLNNNRDLNICDSGWDLVPYGGNFQN